MAAFLYAAISDKTSYHKRIDSVDSLAVQNGFTVKFTLMSSHIRQVKEEAVRGFVQTIKKQLSGIEWNVFEKIAIGAMKETYHSRHNQFTMAVVWWFLREIMKVSPNKTSFPGTNAFMVPIIANYANACTEDMDLYFDPEVYGEMLIKNDVQGWCFFEKFANKIFVNNAPLA